MSENTLTKRDIAEAISAEKDAPSQEKIEKQETEPIAAETVDGLQLTIEETVEESPVINEPIQKASTEEETSQVLVKTEVSDPNPLEQSINEIVPELAQPSVDESPIKHSPDEIVPESAQPGVDESVKEAVIEEVTLDDVQPPDLPEEQNKEKINQEIPAPDAEPQQYAKLETTDEPIEASQEGVVFEETDVEGIPEEEPSAEDVTKVQPEARKSMIPGIDELVEPKPAPPIKEDTEIEHITSMEPEYSQVSLHAEELPEIRGLAELEYLERKESVAVSVIQEDWMDEDYLPSRRKSTRPSIALRKLIAEEDEEPTERIRGRPSRVSDVEGMEEQPLDRSREDYYTVYEKLKSEFPMIRMKNKFLQRKMGDLFKKRKVEHALKEESEIQVDVIEKYKKQLKKLAHLIRVFGSVSVKINNEVDSLQKEKETKHNERQSLFNKLINREKEIGFGLISTKTGKEIPNKVVEQLIRRQLNAAHETSVLRLKYITKRDELAEKTAELKSLDNIGEDLSLMDYEQLKIENRSLADKLEEKEEELTKLRLKCRNAVQVMAHVREKAAALDADMDVLKEDFEDVNYEYIEMRERLNFYKTERDEVRNKTMKLKAESGLLTKPKLLLDMQTSMEEARLLEETLEKVKSEYISKTQQIRTLRKNIAYEMMMNRKPVKKKKQAGSRFYNTRPTLILPKLPSNLMDRLQKMNLGPIKGEKLTEKS